MNGSYSNDFPAPRQTVAERRRGLVYVPCMVRTCLLWFCFSGLALGDFFVDLESPSPVYPYTNATQAAHRPSDVLPLAGDGDRILIAPGIYNLTNDLVITNDVIITGQGTNTILDGQWTHTCFFVRDADPAIDNLVVRNGSGHYGGNLHLTRSAAVISNCVITGGRAWYGGGIYASNAPALVVNSLIHDNIASNPSASIGPNWPRSAGGGIFALDSSLHVGDSAIAGNQARDTGEGGGIAIFHTEFTSFGNTSPVARTTVERSLIISNRTDYTGGGTACLGINFDLPDMTVVEAWFLDCRWEENEAQYGGAFYHVNPGTEPLVVNGLFLRNRSSDNGAALRIFDTYYYPESRWSRATFRNCTLVGNVSTNNHTIYVSDSVFHMVNSIVYTNDTLTNVRVDLDPAVLAPFQEIEFSIVEGGYNGDGNRQQGNLDTDPLFANPGMNDFHLTASSPAVDAGRSGEADDIVADIDGDVRIFGEGVDMGYDEAVVSCHALPDPTAIQVRTPPGAVLSLQHKPFRVNSAWRSVSSPVTAETSIVDIPLGLKHPGEGMTRVLWRK